MPTFQKSTLGQMLSFYNGKAIKPSGEGQYPVYGSNGVIGGCDEFKYSDGIIVGRVGAYCGAVQYCPGKFWASDNTIVVKPQNSNYNAQFLYYLLRDLNLNNYAGGAAQPLVTQTVLKQVEANSPPLKTQRKIASILSAYDDLIENNTRRIKILEEMAQAIYREWFVNFRFPGHEKVKMVDSPLGRVPEGWEVVSLKAIVENVREATSAGAHLCGREYVPIDCLSRKSLALHESKPWEEAQSSLILFHKGEILFGAMRSYFHKVTIAPFDGVTRTTCFVLRPKSPSLYGYAIMTAFQEETVGYASAHARGATIPYAVWDGSLAEMKVLLPSKHVLQKFEKAAGPMLKLIQGAFQKLRNLRQTRDLLLPKLISGEVEVSELATKAGVV